jgi:hypothetical protein
MGAVPVIGMVLGGLMLVACATATGFAVATGDTVGVFVFSAGVALALIVMMLWMTEADR